MVHTINKYWGWSILAYHLLLYIIYIIFFNFLFNNFNLILYLYIILMNYSDSQKIKSLIETFDKIDIIEYHYFINQLKDK